MSKAARKRLAAAREGARIGSSTVQIPLSAMVGSFNLSGYQGAGSSPNRGFIYWPTLDPTREQSPFTRREMARRIHFLKANVGLPKRILKALVNLVIGAGMWPQALTTNRDWNRKATKYYERRASSAVTFDVTSKFALGEFQRQAYETQLADADAAIVYTYSESGRLLRKLYSGLQIGNSSFDLVPQEKWIDGVFRDTLERPALYRFLTQDGKRQRDIEAAKMAFLAKYPTPGAVRGESILAHAVNKLIDIPEIHTSWTTLIKNTSQIGYYLAAASGGGGSAPSMPQSVLDRLNKGQKAEVTGPDGKKVTLKVVMGNGDEIVELPPGYDIKTLLDERPHQNQGDHVDELIRDICWGAGLSFDLIWKIYKLGGANTRYMLADAQSFVETEQDRLIFSWLMRDYAQTIAAGIACGDLELCPDPEWWAHGWLPPARMTVDFGRDGKIYLEEYSRGLITTERYFALKGQDAKEEFLSECDFAEFRRDEMSRRKLTEADFDYMRRGNGAAQAADKTDSPDDENGDGGDKTQKDE